MSLYAAPCFLTFVAMINPFKFLNQARTGRRPARAWFLKIDPVRMSVCVFVCVFVCVSAPEAINN